MKFILVLTITTINDTYNPPLQFIRLNKTMICSYCQGFSLSQSRFYQISNVKERFIPTYYHHPIFSTPQPQPPRVRCSPTFHSKAMDISGYHCCSKVPKNSRPKNTFSYSKIPKSTYEADYKRCKDETFYNYCGGSCYNSRCGWYDGGKEEVLMNLNDGRGYSRQRKLVDLASSSVFEGYKVQPYPQQYINKQQQYPVERELARPIPDEQRSFHHLEAQTQTIDNQIERGVKSSNEEAPIVPKKQQQQTITFGKKKQDLRANTCKKTKACHSKVGKTAVSTKPCFTVIRTKK